MIGRFIRGLDNFTAPDAGTTVTIGTFDGLHRGHQAIFDRLRSAAGTSQIPLIVTFDPHPRVLLSPTAAPMLLTTLLEKRRILEDSADLATLVLPFTPLLRELTAEQFVIDILLARLGMKHLVVGYDHAFGRDRGGTPEALEALGRQHGFEVSVVSPVDTGDRPISSTRIRNALVEGRFSEARELLGRPYLVMGTVGRGIALGRKLGYPTANLIVDRRKLLPAEGVYACRAELADGQKSGMLFIGHNYFNPDAGVTVEVNLFDFDRDIYDQSVAVALSHFIRENRRFETTDELVKQIENDKRNVIALLDQETS